MKSHQLRDANGHQLFTHGLLEKLGQSNSSSPIDPKLIGHHEITEPNGKVTIVQVTPPRGGKHRIFAQCWHCAEFIPAGRMSQHYKGHKEGGD